MGNRLSMSNRSGPSILGEANDIIVKNLEMSPEADEFLADPAQRTDLNEGNVLRLALVLLRTAVDAKRQGKHVGIVENSDSLDTELVGF